MKINQFELEHGLWRCKNWERGRSDWIEQCRIIRGCRRCTETPTDRLNILSYKEINSRRNDGHLAAHSERKSTQVHSLLQSRFEDILPSFSSHRSVIGATDFNRISADFPSEFCLLCWVRKWIIPVQIYLQRRFKSHGQKRQASTVNEYLVMLIFLVTIINIMAAVLTTTEAPADEKWMKLNLKTLISWLVKHISHYKIFAIFAISTFYHNFPRIRRKQNTRN